ncbi:hypothetical protein RF11_06069 [Thelohanellus kitauei]|uniref:Uncharacterized protein n=1 Tax=Thelohanellus kitauei TaxID=669202 RepID=A0A0C2JMR5_THEKT|nr:hypothetical protein RF11_06069 [Thelohanellus kitauei]
MPKARAQGMKEILQEVAGAEAMIDTAPKIKLKNFDHFVAHGGISTSIFLKNEMQDNGIEIQNPSIEIEFELQNVSSVTLIKTGSQYGYISKEFCIKRLFTSRK